MSWRVEIQPEVESDVAEAACWYEAHQSGLSAEFVEEIIHVLDDLAKNPLLNARRHPRKNIRWRYPSKFPYRVIYEVLEAKQIVVVAAVLHAARADRHWLQRIKTSRDSVA